MTFPYDAAVVGYGFLRQPDALHLFVYSMIGEYDATLNIHDPFVPNTSHGIMVKISTDLTCSCIIWPQYIYFALITVCRFVRARDDAYFPAASV